MLDGLLGRGFSPKCKSLIKPTKTRIEVLRKREEAKQRFLKEDLAKLLANGLDINAYGRVVKQTEEFLAGACLLSCYDFIDWFCEHILKQLSIMQKQSECPEDCREAVSSLMFAAARFSDLPELRDLRDVFQERYGNALEYFVNQVFAVKLASKLPTMEKRVQLLQDIASEFSINWDSRGFEQRMANPSAFAHDQSRKYGPSRVTDDKYKLPNAKDTLWKADKHDVTYKERHELVNDGHTMCNGREGNVSRREETNLKGDNNDISFRGRQEFTAEKHGSSRRKGDTTPNTVRSGSSSRGKSPECVDGGYTFQNDRANTVPKVGKQDPLPRGKSEATASCTSLPVNSDGKAVAHAGNDHGSGQNIVKSTRKVQEEEAERLKSSYNSALPPYVKLKDNSVPPPYIKSKGSNYEASSGSKYASFDGDRSSMDPSPRNRANAVISSDRIQKEPDHSHNEEQGSRPGRVNSHGHGHEKDHYYQNDIPLPKPRSVRRKHSKSSSGHDDVGNSEDARIVKRSSSSRRKEHSKKGLQILFDDEQYENDEEERKIDKLLLHYSKKPSTYDVGKLRKKSRDHPSTQISADVNSEIVPPPSRSISLPHEQSAPSEAIKVFARTNSFQPYSQAAHVHPKLPDYDDLAARFAALKGR